jgi:hypothetical protein
MVDMPLFLFSELLPADSAFTVLKVVEVFDPVAVVFLFKVTLKTFLEIGFPLRVIRVGLRPDLGVPSDWG